MGLAARSSSSTGLAAAGEVMDIENGASQAESVSPSSIELFCICIHCPYDLLDELARRVKMEVIVEVCVWCSDCCQTRREQAL
eukprot:1157332-Pelagomonas_calceolata.AAC.1